jgi:hypothetical protein
MRMRKRMRTKEEELTGDRVEQMQMHHDDDKDD